ncbi:hypothetical protein [Jiella sp. M17.18]|uniref:hypothetical protein n=1 Tax=Jiella sp. M17.18 TaxID=3234247 RepID=UPI0034DFE760
MMRRLLILSVLPLALSGCAGMNRAVGVLPNTADDIAATTQGRPAVVDGQDRRRPDPQE